VDFCGGGFQGSTTSNDLREVEALSCTIVLCIPYRTAMIVDNVTLG
jgi:hypothetical protein